MARSAKKIQQKTQGKSFDLPALPSRGDRCQGGTGVTSRSRTNFWGPGYHGVFILQEMGPCWVEMVLMVEYGPEALGDKKSLGRHSDYGKALAFKAGAFPYW